MGEIWSKKCEHRKGQEGSSTAVCVVSVWMCGCVCVFSPLDEGVEVAQRPHQRQVRQHLRPLQPPGDHKPNTITRVFLLEN